jgi:lysophospholipase L1-like esterase
MKKITTVLLAIFCMTGFFANAQQPLKPIFKKGDRICFIGNSITHNGEFHHNILLYYVTRFPKRPVSFYNAGIKGDVTGGILHRIDDDILVHRPTHAVIMIGMNDVQRHLYGNTITQDADTLARRKVALELYRNNLDSIIRIFIRKGVKVILQKPSPYDQTSTIKIANGLGVNDALYECATIMQTLATKYKLPTIDYWTLMTDITRQLQAKNPTATLTVNDRVHPNSTGHMIMAYQFLKSTYSPSVVSEVVLDVKKINYKAANSNCAVKTATYTNNTLSATIVENALPFPVAENQQQAISLIPFMQDLNTQLLQVKNLPEGRYQLLIDSTVIDHFSSDSLQEGINLALYRQTPQYKQAVEVRNRLHQLWELEATLRAIAFTEYMHLSAFSKKGDMTATKKYLDSLYAARFYGQQYYANSFEKYIAYKSQVTQLRQQSDSLRRSIYRQAQPVAHVFTIKKVEEPSVNTLIEASQSGAMPLLFEVQPKFALQKVDSFASDKEFFVRGGLPNFFNKLSQKNPTLHIAFLGGSITKAEDQYRNQTLVFIQSLNPHAIVKGINAGVSGTGTELGACRVKEQVLKYNPDLVFVEFAVNGGSNEAMEGIVRQIITNNPQTDICFIYTIAGEQYKQYAANEVPAKIQGFEKVASHYQIPSIHLGLYPSLLVAQGQVVWKSSSPISGQIVFSKDGTHPAKEGGDLYTQAIIRAFRVFGATAAVRNHTLIEPLYADHWADAGMFAPAEAATFSKGWEIIRPSEEDRLRAFAPWFSTVSKTAVANASCTFKFKGDVFGFFDIGGPEVGQVLVEIDGKCVELTRKAGNVSASIPNESGFKCLMNRFNAYCNNRYRGQFEMIAVPDGVHEVKISLSPVQADKSAILAGQDVSDIQQNPDKYNQQVFYLGKILVRGTIIHK